MASDFIREYTTRQDLLHQALLDAGGKHERGRYTCPSPQHEDKHPSTSIMEKDGHWKFTCHACGAHGDVIDVMGMARNVPNEQIIRELKGHAAPVLPPEPKATPKAEPKKKKTHPTRAAIIGAAEWANSGKCTRQDDYRSPTGEVLYSILRIDTDSKKQFWPIHPVPGGWQSGYAEGAHTIFNLDKIPAATVVVVVEGEKCAQALTDIGIVATTSPGGARRADRADWSPLQGKLVYIWPDNDPLNEDGESAGQNYARTVIKELSSLPEIPDIWAIDPAAAGLGEKEDAYDYIEALKQRGGSRDVIKLKCHELMDEAIPAGPSKGLWDLIEDIAAGKQLVVPWPHRMLSNYTNALLPGTVTIFCGDPGSAKSFFLLQCMWHWHTEGHDVALMELEDDSVFHLQRALVQISENNKNFDRNWIHNQPDEARQAYKDHKHFLDSFIRCIYQDPDITHSLMSLAEWVEKQCEQKKRVIAIDPVTIADVGGDPWVVEREFMRRVKTAVTAAGASLILVTHPKKGRQNQISLDQLSGSTAFPRFSHTVLWLEHLPDDKEHDLVTFEDHFGQPKEVRLYAVKSNKIMHMCKTRLGRGHGLRLAYKLTGKSMTVAEQGLLVKDECQN